jgi:hypothetical protein
VPTHVHFENGQENIVAASHLEYLVLVLLIEHKNAFIERIQLSYVTSVLLEIVTKMQLEVHGLMINILSREQMNMKKNQAADQGITKERSLSALLLTEHIYKHKS